MKKQAAPMSKGKPTSGGGLTSNKHHKVPLKAGQRRVDAVSPGGADQLGQAMGRRRAVEPLVEGKPKAATDLGNYRAEHCEQGPGGGRTIYESGYQALHGTPVQGESNPSPDPASVRDPNHSFSDKPRAR
jgi:hypothetical protein